MTCSPLRWLAAAILVLLPAGCGDQMARPGTWQASGTIAANLASAVVDKQDLIMGQPDSGASGEIAAMAIDRLRQDKTKSLNTVTTTSIGGAAGASN